MAIQHTMKGKEMAKGNRYTKDGSITGSVDLKIVRIGDHIYLTIKGAETAGIEIPVDDWNRLTTRKAPPIGFSTINRNWRINDLNNSSVGAARE